MQVKSITPTEYRLEIVSVPPYFVEATIYRYTKLEGGEKPFLLKKAASSRFDCSTLLDMFRYGFYSHPVPVERELKKAKEWAAKMIAVLEQGEHTWSVVEGD